MRTHSFVLLVLSCAFLGIGNLTTSASAMTWTVEVPSSVPWFDTGIDLTSGELLQIDASGTVRLIEHPLPGSTPMALDLAGTVQKH